MDHGRTCDFSPSEPLISLKRGALGTWVAVVLSLAPFSGLRAQTGDRDGWGDFPGAASPSQPAPFPAQAQRPPAPRPGLAGPIDPAAYRLGPGDVLSLEYGGRALESRSVVIDGEGRARFPNLGVVDLGGRTLAEARADIVRRMRPYVPGASVDLRLMQPRTFKVYVLGEVAHTGVQEVTGSARAIEAIEAAGGATAAGSRRNVRVVRRDGRAVGADLERFERTGDWEANPYLEDGDRVIVPVRVDRFGVYGAVARPGTYEFRDGDSLSTALRMVGGTRPEARLDSVLVIRFRGAHAMDTLVTSLGPGAATGALALQADDRVFVRPRPEWRPVHQVTLSGEVAAPGVYAIEEGRSRVGDLVRWAGGFTSKAARQTVRIERGANASERDAEFERLSRLTRAEMTTSEYQTFQSKLALRQPAYIVDFSGGGPRPAADVPLRDGDLVHVPRLELAVRVDGAVNRPGLVTFQEGRRLREYLALAGGTSRRADAGDARLTRSGSSHTVFARDIGRIEPGDYIWVPERKESSFWATFRDAVIVTGQVATIILVIDQLGN